MTAAISCRQLILRLNDTVHDFYIVMMTSLWHALLRSADPVVCLQTVQFGNLHGVSKVKQYIHLFYIAVVIPREEHRWGCLAADF